MYDKIYPADYARLIKTVTRRSQSLRRLPVSDFFHHTAQAARSALCSIKLRVKVHPGALRQSDGYGA